MLKDTHHCSGTAKKQKKQHASREVLICYECKCKEKSGIDAKEN